MSYLYYMTKIQFSSYENWSIDNSSNRAIIFFEIKSLVRRGVCVRHRPLPRKVERHQGVDQVRPAKGFIQSGWGERKYIPLRYAVPKLNQWGLCTYSCDCLSV